MEHPAVSVIIPVWNSGKYFRECLDSVLSQSLRNIEVLIVDDASTDGSGAVAEEYASRDARITVMHHPSSTGAGPARNRAMAVARGEYIAFMDSDDLYPSNDVLEMLYYKAVEKHADVCGGSLYKIDAEGKLLRKQNSEQIFKKEGWCRYYEYQYDGGFYRFLYRREFLKREHLIFPNYKRFQDPVFFVCTMISSKIFYVIPFWVYAYRKEYKVIEWNIDKIKGKIYGVIDILNISNKYNLHKLHYNMAKNFLNIANYDINNICKKIYFIYMLFKIIFTINWSVIKEQNKINITKIFIYKIIYYYIC